MIQQIADAGKALKAAVLALENEVSCVRMTPHNRDAVNGARIVLTIALGHCREAYKLTQAYDLLADRAGAELHKGAKKNAGQGDSLFRRDGGSPSRRRVGGEGVAPDAVRVRGEGAEVVDSGDEASGPPGEHNIRL